MYENLIDRLRTLSAQAEEVMFERVQIVATLIADIDWVKSQGNKHKALVYLQGFFKDLCGAIELEQLLEVYQEFPTVEQWREYDCNLQRLWWNGVQGKKLERSRNQRAKDDLEYKRKKARENYQARKNRSSRSNVGLNLGEDNIVAATVKDLAATISDVIKSHPEADRVWYELKLLMDSSIRRRA